MNFGALGKFLFAQEVNSILFFALNMWVSHTYKVEVVACDQGH